MNEARSRYKDPGGLLTCIQEMRRDRVVAGASSKMNDNRTDGSLCISRTAQKSMEKLWRWISRAKGYYSLSSLL